MSGTALEALSLLHLSGPMPLPPSSSTTYSTISSEESSDLPNDAMTSIDASDTSTDNKPRFPAEIMQNIFKHAQQDNLSSLPAVLRTSKLSYELAMPILYETIHLNRNTLPGLARYMSIDPTERKKKQLSEVTTLVIDDITMMFGFTWEDDLKLFCQSIVLPNVTRVIWREDESREMDKKSQKLRDRFNGGKLGNPTQRSPTNCETNYKFQVTLPKQFTPVLPAEKKDVLVVIPPSGQFQQMGPVLSHHLMCRPRNRYTFTSDRVMKYIHHMSGQNTLEIRQSFNSEYLVLSDTVGVTYSTYPDPDTPYPIDRSRIISRFENTVARRLVFLDMERQQWTDQLAPSLRDSLMSDLGPEDIMDACKEAMLSELGPRFTDLMREEGQWGISFMKMLTDLTVFLDKQRLLFGGED